MNRFNDFEESVLPQDVSTGENGKVFSVPVSISVLKQDKCYFCSKSQGFIVTEEKLENGQVLTKSEVCPVCNGSGRKT